MRKISNKVKQFQKKQQLRLRKKEQRIASIRRNAKFQRSRFRQKYIKQFSLLDSRNDLRRSLYRKRYIEKPKIVYIEGDFGIEDDSRTDYFFEKAFEIIDFNNRELTINLEKCTRVWPSAITMLCSLKQWVELSTRESKRTPTLKSTTSIQHDIIKGT